MKILHVITSLRTGGAEKLLLDLLPLISSGKHQVDLVLFDGVETPFLEEAHKRGINVISFSVGRNVYNPLNILRLRALMADYDIIHTHNTAPQLFAALASVGKKTRLITTEHSTSNRRRAWKGYKIIDRWMYSRYSKVICISQIAEDILRKYLGSETNNITTIENGVDLRKLSEAKAGDVLEKLAPGSKKIINVSGFRAEKDQATLIRSLTELPAEFHLFLVGDGVTIESMKELALSLGVNNRTHFLGLRSDVPSLLKEADFTVMSSHYEGLSLASVEGMSVGKPFLASDVNGLREVTEGAGVLFEHENPKDFAEKVLQLSADSERYAKVSEECMNRAKRYDISSTASRYLDVYAGIE